jgi:hypothetical protein
MRNIVLVLLVGLLTGCGGGVLTKVSVFHEFEEPVSGLTYAIVPSKEQESSLEFRSYAKLVKAALGEYGMTETPLDQAKYAVHMGYGIDDGEQVISSSPIIGQTGISGAHTTGRITSYGNTASYSATTYTTPTFGIVGSRTKSETVYRRYLNIDIIDVAKSGNGKVQKVYEGRAESTGENSQLAAVMQAIVWSVFEDFPGESGASWESEQSIDEDD